MDWRRSIGCAFFVAGPGGTFRYENFISNERSIQYVIPDAVYDCALTFIGLPVKVRNNSLPIIPS